MLFDYLGLHGSLEEQASEFLEKARQNAQWCQDSIIAFLDFHNKRVKSKELAAGTLKNYYRAAKLFCEMNDLTTINWKKISRGLLFSAAACEYHIALLLKTLSRKHHTCKSH